MRLLIPTTGTHLKLTAPWTFRLYHESRNFPLRKALNLSADYRDSWGKANEFVAVTMPKGTVLTVDRIYLRKGAEDFDSITFRIHTHSTDPKTFKKARFWAKLPDVNQIECDLDPGTTPGLTGKALVGVTTNRFGDRSSFEVGDRVIVRGVKSAGVGFVLGETKSKWTGKVYSVAMPSYVKGVIPILCNDGKMVVFGTQTQARDLKLATDEEIAADEAKRTKLQKRREKAAVKAVQTLKTIYANPLTGNDLEIIQGRHDRDMEKRFASPWGWGSDRDGTRRSYDVDVSRERFHKLCKTGDQDAIQLAMAQHMPFKHEFNRYDHATAGAICWGGYHWGDGPKAGFALTAAELRIMAAVQMGYLPSLDADAVLRATVADCLSPLTAGWVSGQPHFKSITFPKGD